jgi:Tfp pilus assembly protein PilF
VSGPLRIARAAASPLVVVIVILLAAWLTLHHAVGQLDVRFFRFSRDGIRGLVLYRQGRYTEAARAYRASFRSRFVMKYPEDAAGAQAVVGGDEATAIRWARLSLMLVPSALEPRVTLAEVAVDRGDFAAARATLDEVLARQPDHLDALYLSAVVAARLGDQGAAIERLNHGLIRHMAPAGRPLTLWRVVELIGDLQALPEAKRPLCLLAHLHRYLRIYDPSQADAVVANAQAAIARGDRPAEAWVSIAIVRAKQHRVDEAVAAMHTALTLDPRQTDAALWLSGDAGIRSDLLEQQRLARVAFEARPTDPYVLSLVDDLLVTKLGDHHGVIALMERALAVDPEYVPAHERLAAAALRVGDRALARRHQAIAARLAASRPRDDEDE